MADEKRQALDGAPNLWNKPWPVKEVPLRVEMGDLSLTIIRLNHEWQLHYQWLRRGSDGPFCCDYLTTEAPAGGSLDRLAMESMANEVSFRPRLADRPVVVRPYSALTIPGNNKITLYISTPLWLSLEFSAQLTREFPLQQLSDTWMGSVTGRGELCYGSHTHARLDKNLLPQLPYRALTPATIHNTSPDNLILERLSIPAPFLSLQAAEDQLVTEPLSITMDSNRLYGTVEIGKATSTEVISTPRKTADKGLLVSAWENLFA